MDLKAPVPPPSPDRRTFLFLQGPLAPFFRRIAARLEARGHRCLRVNLNLGDALFWRRPGGIAYRGRRCGWPAFVADLLDREEVTDVVLMAEQRWHHRVAIAQAQARGIRVVATDFGYLRPDWITLERDGMTGWSRFPRDPDAIRALARAVPSPDLRRHYEDSFFWLAFWDVLYHASAILGWCLFPFHRWEHVHHPLAVYAGMVPRLLTSRRRERRARRLIEAVRSDARPYFLFPLQMENDAQIQAYSPYRDLDEPIAAVVASFATHAPGDARLLVKLHPLDPGLRDFGRVVRREAARAGVAERVSFFDGGSLDRLLAGARGVVTINSTAGLWALRHDCPVVTLGDAVYNVPGLVTIGALDGFWRDPRPPDPELRDAFIRAVAGTIQVRGVYHLEPGLSAAVEAAAERLATGCVNRPLPVAAPAAAASPAIAAVASPG